MGRIEWWPCRIAGRSSRCPQHRVRASGDGIREVMPAHSRDSRLGEILGDRDTVLCFSQSGLSAAVAGVGVALSWHSRSGVPSERHSARDMSLQRDIDTSFDVRSDTPPGKDPDALSPTLRRYHRQLWSKPLPNGTVFSLVTTTPRVYLHHSLRSANISCPAIPSFRLSRAQRVSLMFSSRFLSKNVISSSDSAIRSVG